VTAIDDLSLSFYEGELRCIIGPNGAGKSTLFNLITGAVKPDRGQIYFDGRDITRYLIHKIAQMGITRKLQITSVFDTLTIEKKFSCFLDLKTTEYQSDPSSPGFGRP
jgi:ABC-type uncharacterized transport system ATPase subunit